MTSITVYSDIACPWASLTVWRLHQARARLGLDDAVLFDHRAFPLEIINGRGTPKRILDAEVAVVGGHEPALGWQMWRAPSWQYAVSSLLALEAVQAAKDPVVGGPGASEELDLALRQALYAQSRCISLHSVVLEVAAECPSIDAGALAAALERGDARKAVFDQWRETTRVGVQGSPHLYLPDGSDVHNPGITMSWTGSPGHGLPVIEADDPTVYDDLLARAAG